PRSIPLVHDVPAERLEPGPRGVSRGGRPGEAPPVRKRDIADAECREHSQRAERVLDRMPALDADEARDPPGLEIALDVRRAVGQREVAGMLRGEPVDQVDL